MNKYQIQKLPLQKNLGLGMYLNFLCERKNTKTRFQTKTT